MVIANFLILLSAMAGSMVAGMAALAIGTGKRSPGPGSNPNSSSSSGSTGDKSAEPGKINGTRGSFNVKGDDSLIQVLGGNINSGYCSGFMNVRKAAFQDRHPLEECGGTDQSFNVEAGGKIIVAGGSICSGAFSGAGIPQEFLRQYLPNLQPAVAPSHHSIK